MEILNVGSPELLIVLLLAAIILGPERIAGVARKLGTVIRELRGYFQELSTGLKEELDILDELKEVKKDIEKELKDI